MNKIILTAATVSLGIMFAAAGTATAQTRAPAKPTPTAQMKIAPVASTAAHHNTAPAWTAGCYAEFGPNATHPDSALLEKCLSL